MEQQDLRASAARRTEASAQRPFATVLRVQRDEATA